MSESSNKAAKVVPQPKITRAQIASKVVKAEKDDKEKEKIETHLDVPLIENVNRLAVDGEEARTIEEAITVLGYVTTFLWCI